MRSRLLIPLAVASAALLVGVAAAAGGIPGSAYQWQQPGTAPVTTPGAQPVLSVPSVPLLGLRYATSAYTWVQPGTSLPRIPYYGPR